MGHRFCPDKQFGNFGSVGAAWIFTNENIFKSKYSVLSFGKIREVLHIQEMII